LKSRREFILFVVLASVLAFVIGCSGSQHLVSTSPDGAILVQATSRADESENSAPSNILKGVFNARNEDIHDQHRGLGIRCNDCHWKGRSTPPREACLTCHPDKERHMRRWVCAKCHHRRRGGGIGKGFGGSK